ncbi:MAG: zinc dependent phospholipase C family protein [Gemmatimonadales bacterium]
MRFGALLAGSVAPDAPLLLLTAGYYLYRRITDATGPHGLYGPDYDRLFYYDPFWVFSHNILHAPLIIIPLVLIGLYKWHASHSPRGAALFWFSVGCAFHSVTDVFTHHADGPLLLFPFNWNYRFVSPVSYWHPAFYGRIFGTLETATDLAIVTYLAISWLRRKRIVSVPKSVPAP